MFRERERYTHIHMYICIYTCLFGHALPVPRLPRVALTAVVCDKRKKENSSGEEDVWKHFLSEHQIRGWRAVSAAGLQGNGSHERSVFSQTPVSLRLLLMRVLFLLLLPRAGYGLL